MCSILIDFFFSFFKQKTAYEMRISDWSSDVCTSDLVELDVSNEAQWLAALANCDRIDILVNNAGITTHGSIEDLTLDAFRHEFSIDVDGVFLGCKHIIPKMKDHGGSVINMSSMCGVRAQGDLAAYNAAKAAVTHLTKSVALHYARKGYGIRCNSVH